MSSSSNVPSNGSIKPNDMLLNLLLNPNEKILLEKHASITNIFNEMLNNPKEAEGLTAQCSSEIGKIEYGQGEDSTTMWSIFSRVKGKALSETMSLTSTYRSSELRNEAAAGRFPELPKISESELKAAASTSDELLPDKLPELRMYARQRRQLLGDSCNSETEQLTRRIGLLMERMKEKNLTENDFGKIEEEYESIGKKSEEIRKNADEAADNINKLTNNGELSIPKAEFDDLYRSYNSGARKNLIAIKPKLEKEIARLRKKFRKNITDNHNVTGGKGSEKSSFLNRYNFISLLGLGILIVLTASLLSNNDVLKNIITEEKYLSLSDKNILGIYLGTAGVGLATLIVPLLLKLKKKST